MELTLTLADFAADQVEQEDSKALQGNWDSLTSGNRMLPVNS